MTNANAVDHARQDGLQVVTIPDSIHAEIAGSKDVAGGLVRDLGTYQAEWNDSFTFDWVAPKQLDAHERETFDLTNRIVPLVGGLPQHVKAVKISRTMREDFTNSAEVVGLWDGGTSSIVIRRDQLRSVATYGGTLLHEVAHARSGFSDVTRDFETELTTLLGMAASAAVSAHGQPSAKVADRFSIFKRR